MSERGLRGPDRWKMGGEGVAVFGAMGDVVGMSDKNHAEGVSPHEVFAGYLKRKNMNMTAQRRAILDRFMDCASHLTSEELYELVRETDPGIGHATVFRTLKLLEESGVARLVRFKDGLMRYECALGREHHDHMVCDVCGREFEVSAPELGALLEKLAARADFSLTGHTTYLSGICSECRARRGGSDG